MLNALSYAAGRANCPGCEGAAASAPLPPSPVIPGEERRCRIYKPRVRGSGLRCDARAHRTRVNCPGCGGHCPKTVLMDSSAFKCCTA